MAKAEIIGTWFPTGYHGHYRSKSRLDIYNEYRQLAKPQPPKNFYKRQKEPITRHLFSKHDNKHSFQNDALYFEEGHGRRRLKNNTNNTKTDLLTWGPTKIELDKKGPTPSVYRYDYRMGCGDENKQQIVRRPKTSFDNDVGVNCTTSYRYAHGSYNPNKKTLSAMSNDGLLLFKNQPTQQPNRKERAQTARYSAGRESVASCMTWHVPKPPTLSRPLTCHATSTSVAPAAETSSVTAAPPVVPPQQTVTVGGE